MENFGVFAFARGKGMKTNCGKIGIYCTHVELKSPCIRQPTICSMNYVNLIGFFLCLFSNECDIREFITIYNYYINVAILVCYILYKINRRLTFVYLKDNRKRFK